MPDWDFQPCPDLESHCSAWRSADSQRSQVARQVDFVRTDCWDRDRALPAASRALDRASHQESPASCRAAGDSCHLERHSPLKDYLKDSPDSPAVPVELRQDIGRRDCSDRDRTPLDLSDRPCLAAQRTVHPVVAGSPVVDRAALEGILAVPGADRPAFHPPDRRAVAHLLGIQAQDSSAAMLSSPESVALETVDQASPVGLGTASRAVPADPAVQMGCWDRPRLGTRTSAVQALAVRETVGRASLADQGTASRAVPADPAVQMGC